ncbi:MAG: tRNA (adenosine(37)-N6)-threonylcarbamoyltransferase complex dimerization subunit type 1 TsaB, partial [Alphaproteobacteria bacterium]|nr:tRNA (adenosine(37)-N6)-threonylcarbamoyltransferase complex dimerization subunit type 1 TsaB [Alphaproteobacteria bacterium]
MRILALDSATSRRSIALLAEGKVLARRVVQEAGQSDG